MKLFKPGDIVPLLITAGTILLISLNVYTPSEGEPRLYIRADNIEYIYPLDEERTVEVQGPLGFSYIRIENGEAFFADSPCPDKLCVKAAPVRSDGQWNACLPNRIFIRVQGEDNESEAPDDISY